MSTYTIATGATTYQINGRDRSGGFQAMIQANSGARDYPALTGELHQGFEDFMCVRRSLDTRRVEGGLTPYNLRQNWRSIQNDCGISTDAADTHKVVLSIARAIVTTDELLHTQQPPSSRAEEPCPAWWPSGVSCEPPSLPDRPHLSRPHINLPLWTSRLQHRGLQFYHTHENPIIGIGFGLFILAGFYSLRSAFRKGVQEGIKRITFDRDSLEARATRGDSERERVAREKDAVIDELKATISRLTREILDIACQFNKVANEVITLSGEKTRANNNADAAARFEGRARGFHVLVNELRYELQQLTQNGNVLSETNRDAERALDLMVHNLQNSSKILFESLPAYIAGIENDPKIDEFNSLCNRYLNDLTIQDTKKRIEQKMDILWDIFQKLREIYEMVNNATLATNRPSQPPTSVGPGTLKGFLKG